MVVLQGSSFATISEMTDVFEGSIVRFMRRLDELLSQLVKACTVSLHLFIPRILQPKFNLNI